MVIDYRRRGNRISPVYKTIDSLHALVDIIFERKSVVGKGDRHHELLYEREAHLYGDVPLPLIREFYPELYDYGNQLIRETLFNSSIYSQSLVNYSNLVDLENAGAEAGFQSILSMRPENFNLPLVDEILFYIKNYVRQGKRLDECEELLKTIINKGYRVGEANLVLASIAHHRKDYKAACQSYKRAEKRGYELTIDQELFYSHSLLEIMEYKQAEKKCIKALQLDDSILGRTKPEFKKILEAVRSHYHRTQTMRP